MQTRQQPISPSITVLLATAGGVIVANIYYAQPLVGLIGPAIGLPAEAGSLVVTLPQISYGAGLILLVPLGDLLENRRLVAVTLCSGGFRFRPRGWETVTWIGCAFPMAALLLYVTEYIGQRRPA